MWYTVYFTLFAEKSESPAVRNFFLTLGEQWESVAKYLGYTKEELEDIVQKFPDSVENQVSSLSLSLSLSYSTKLCNVYTCKGAVACTWSQVALLQNVLPLCTVM